MPIRYPLLTLCILGGGAAGSILSPIGLWAAIAGVWLSGTTLMLSILDYETSERRRGAALEMSGGGSSLRRSG